MAARSPLCLRARPVSSSCDVYLLLQLPLFLALVIARFWMSVISSTCSEKPLLFCSALTEQQQVLVVRVFPSLFMPGNPSFLTQFSSSFQQSNLVNVPYILIPQDIFRVSGGEKKKGEVLKITRTEYYHTDMESGNGLAWKGS